MLGQRKYRRSRSKRFVADQGGSTSIEFIMIFPLFFLMFALSLESGFLTTQKIFLERAVDMTLRKMSLETQWDDMSADAIAERICNEGLLSECGDRLTIEAVKISPLGAFTLGPIKCLDISEDEDLKPANSYSGGVSFDDYLFIRVCLLVDPLFKATPLTPTLELNASGGYYLSAMGMLVVEPDEENQVGPGAGS